DLTPLPKLTSVEFRIKALDASASVVSCVIDAVDEAEARRQLALRQLKIISLEPVRRLRRLFQAPQLQVAVFSQQLVSLLEAGLSLVEALEALAQKESNAGTKHTLDRILARLYEGQTLAAAIAEHPATFPDLYVASVRASEKTGALREALTRYIAYQEQADTLRKTLVNACIYPAVLLVAGLLVTLFLMGYVVPRFSSIYEDVGTELPVAARMLRVGERSGNMGEMMERIADFCDEELGRWVAVMTRLIEPVLMIVIGLVIGVIVVLMYFPIFQLAGSIR